MFIDTPSNTLAIAQRENGRTSDGTHYLLRMRRDASLFYWSHHDATPSSSEYRETADYLSDITGLAITSEQTEKLLSLYPFVRIKIAQYGGIDDTDVRDELNFTAAHFFMGSKWPRYGDGTDMNNFLLLLQSQALAMGFIKRSRGE